jgi:hypothetical protein
MNLLFVALVLIIAQSCAINSPVFWDNPNGGSNETMAIEIPMLSEDEQSEDQSIVSEAGFCPIVLDPRASDCQKIENLMVLLGNYDYVGEFCRGPEVILKDLQDCCRKKTCQGAVRTLLILTSKVAEDPSYADLQ